ncbi:MAG: hypothetical protein H0V31_02595 [Acidobacteria bacterium]|nr:hypothetical protein [Acidobacteriota bacterium]
MLFAFGINHKTAPIEVREKLYIHESEIPDLLTKLKETLLECVILSTCNRTEIYGVCGSADVDLDFYKDLVIKFKNAEEIVTKEHFLLQSRVVIAMDTVGEFTVRDLSFSKNL